VGLASADPGQSLPDQMASVADRDALDRFLANRKVTLAGMLSGHVRQTQTQMRGQGTVRVVHETSTFRFLGDRWRSQDLVDRWHARRSAMPISTQKPVGRVRST
jgi:hypothetical protein